MKDLVAKTGHGASRATQKEAVKGADIVVIAVPGGTAAGEVVKSSATCRERSSSTRPIS